MENVLCKGFWYDDEDEINQEFCPLREKCYRYKNSMKSFELKTYFDLIPYYNDKCDYYLPDYSQEYKPK